MSALTDTTCCQGYTVNTRAGNVCAFCGGLVRAIAGYFWNHAWWTLYAPKPTQGAK